MPGCPRAEAVSYTHLYVHNDTCYPALLSIGQLMHALHSGKYDLHKVALIMTQTGGGCRASNYIHLLRKALKKDGLEFIPVISVNLSGLESNPGFKITPVSYTHLDVYKRQPPGSLWGGRRKSAPRWQAPPAGC